MIRNSLLLLVLTVPTAANACGGFFCNRDDGVDQKSEEIVFAVDEENGEITTHIKIAYEGAADEFAWIVPVAGLPELSVGTDALFGLLTGATQTSHYIQNTYAGDCEFDYATTATSSWGGTYASGTGTGTTGGGTLPGVSVVSQGIVWPYATSVLTATDSGELITWLNDNGYDIPVGLDPLLAPYVASGQHFVALKLSKDRDTGDLSPLVMTYPGTTPSIPIQLTAVAAQPDMRLRVYVLGDERAVPTSYLHVQPNPIAINFWDGGRNYDDVISMAADEAGGQAFATDFSGDPGNLGDSLVWADWDTEELATANTAYGFLVAVATRNFPADDALLEVLDAHIAPIPGTDPVSVYNCPSCYETQLRAMPFDAVAAADDVEVFVVAPRVDAAVMLDRYPVLTRLSSSVSPSEMTVDPMFTFNPDMGTVSNVRTATLLTTCESGQSTTDAPRTIKYSTGFTVNLPPQQALWDAGTDEFAFLSDLYEPYASVIEQTSESGQPVILLDNRGEQHDDIDAFNDSVTGGGADGETLNAAGCGCNNGTMPTSWMALFLLLGLMRRAAQPTA